MKPPYTAGQIHEIIMDHYDKCDDCNYNRGCRYCDGGFGTSEDEIENTIGMITSHSCGCIWGNGVGGTLKRIENLFHLQENVKSMESDYRSLQNKIAMFMIQLGWSKLDD